MDAAREKAIQTEVANPDLKRQIQYLFTYMSRLAFKPSMGMLQSPNPKG